MTADIDDRSRALHLVRCTSMPGTGTVADRAALPTEQALVALSELEGEGLVTHRVKPRDMWTITTTGRATHAQWVHEQIEDRGCRESVREVYTAFLELNPLMLSLCSDWQSREVGGEAVPNDHTDAEHDGAVLDRLREVDARVQELLSVLDAVLPWGSRHGQRFSDALSRIENGDPRWLTGVTIDSYHTVWFELHEELLATLNISREEEAAAIETAPRTDQTA